MIAAPKATAEGKARGGRLGPATLIAALIAVALVAVAVVVGVHVLGSRTKGHATHAPSASVAPPPNSGTAAPTPTGGMKLTSQITDDAGVLTPIEHAAVERAINKLYNGRGTRLWVVYVKNFGGLKPFRWAEDTMLANNFTDSDAILAVATDQAAFAFRVPNAVLQGKAIDLEVIRRDRIAPAVFRHEWARAAIAAANGLDVAPG